MNRSAYYQWSGYCIAAVWAINGLVCKILNLVPRHEMIVSRILQADDARAITVLIGIAEVCMAIWVLSGLWSRFSTLFQMFIIAVMNVLEFVFARDLLLWGKANALFAALFIAFLYVREFHLRRNVTQVISHD